MRVQIYLFAFMAGAASVLGLQAVQAADWWRAALLLVGALSFQSRACKHLFNVTPLPTPPLER